MAQIESTHAAPQANTENSESEPAEKLTISSVTTHAKLLAEIKERNPIIARRDQPKT